MPAGATRLDVAINNTSDPGADLDLFVYNAAGALAGQSADGDSNESVSLANPAAGTYTVVIDGYSVPAGTTQYDYRDVFYSLSVAWRPSSAVGRKIRDIYCYEVQSETHWNIPYVEPGFLPSMWMDIGDTLEVKLEALACYKSQIRPAPDSRSVEAVRALAIWRGSQMGLPAAEAFVTVRSLR